MNIRLEEYLRADGTNPYQTWFDELDAQAAAKVTVAKTRLSLGNTSSVEWFRGIGEYKIDFGPGWRIYLAKDGLQLIVLLGGGSKQTQQADIERALAPWRCGTNTSNARPRHRNEDTEMALTRDFKETIIARIQADPAFARGLLDEAATLFLNGEPETAKLILRDLVNGAIGFERLALEVQKPPKSLHRMLSPSGNPTMNNLAAIFAALKNALRVEMEVHGALVG